MQVILALAIAAVAAVQQASIDPPRHPAIPAMERLDVIHPRDVLTIVVTPEVELSGDYPVDADGRIEMPDVGFLDAAAYTSAAFAACLTEALAYGGMMHPRVTVVVSHAAFRTVFVLGQVGAPGAVTLPSPVTLADALMYADGPTTLAAIGEDQIVVVRPTTPGALRPTALDDPEARRMTAGLDLRNSATTVEGGPGLELQDGDTVYVIRIRGMQLHSTEGVAR